VFIIAEIIYEYIYSNLTEMTMDWTWKNIFSHPNHSIWHHWISDVWEVLKQKFYLLLIKRAIENNREQSIERSNRSCSAPNIIKSVWL